MEHANLFEGIRTVCSPEALAAACEATQMGYDPEGREHPGTAAMNGSCALLYLLYEIRHNEEAPEACIEAAVRQLRTMVAEGNDIAPSFDLSCNWPYCNISAAIALAHKTPKVWGRLTEQEKKKYDFVMECFAYVGALGTNDCNEYRTGPGLKGNFGKGWNPNYRLANIPPMVFVGAYFGGAAAVDKLLLAFDYDKTVAKMQEYGFCRAYRTWTAPVAVVDGVPTRSQKDFMENGGEAFINNTDARLHYEPGVTGGKGEGVRRPYTYRGYTLDESGAIIESLLAHNYAGGAVRSSFGEFEDGSPKSFIADNTKSPMEGREGMMLEFASGDGGDGKHGPDIRSSTSYCYHDFVMVVGLLIATEELGIYRLNDPANREVAMKAWVGNTDYLYKCVHGYMSYSLGKQHGISYEKESTAYILSKTWWNENHAEEPRE